MGTDLVQAASFGVESSLVRISIGLEETGELEGIFEKALKKVEEA